MANIANDVRHGIYDRLLSSNSLKAALAKTVNGTTYYKVYYERAPQALPDGKTLVAPPFVVYTLLPIDSDRDSATKIYRVWIQFLVSSEDLATCEAIAGNITDVMEDSEAGLSIGAYRVVEVRRQSQVSLPIEEWAYNIAVQYSVIFHT